MIEDKLRITLLYDFYQNLLTLKQQQILTMYFENDLTMQEIADNLNISKAAVNDQIKRSAKILEDYESKLNLVLRYNKRKQIYQKLLLVDNADVKKYVNDLIESE